MSVPQVLIDTKLKELYPLLLDVTTADSSQRTAAEIPAREHYPACMMLVWVNDVRFGGLKDDLFNSYLLSGDKFPMTIEDSVGLLNNYKVLKKQQQHDK